MSYRNIDEDLRLLTMAKRYWSEEQLTKEQLYWVLGNEGYSEKEINSAIDDYYQIHLRSNILLHHFIAPILLLLVMILLLVKLYYLIYL